MPQINCLDSHIVEILKKPMRVLSVSFPVKMDDGTIRVFEGYRSQHNDAIGPTNVKLSEVMVSSFHAVNQAAKKYETDLRTAAYMISLQRIVEAMKARGWV